MLNRTRFVLLSSLVLCLSPAAFSSQHPSLLRREEGFEKRAEKEVYRSPGELKAQDEAELRQGMKYLKLIKGDPTSKEIALTFDDGPHQHWTKQLLNLLRANHVRATFFVVGKMAERYPNLIRQELADGHQLANHTYHHVNLTNIPANEVASEYRMCDEAIHRITGRHMSYCRPPGGQYDHDVIQTTERLGLTTVLWTEDPGDYAKPGDGVIQRRLMHCGHNGAIILLHDGIQQTLDVLPGMIKALRQKGYQFVTIDKMHHELATKLAQMSRSSESGRRAR